MAKPVLLKPVALVPESATSTGAVELADVPRVLEVAAARARAGIPGAMATVLARRGSTPSTPGQKLYVAADGTRLGTVGGGAVEREVLRELVAMVERAGAPDGEPKMRTFRLGSELGMCCGGTVDVVLEPLARLVPCLIVGGGHVGTAAAPALARLGFAVTLVDAREEWASGARFPDPRVRVVAGDFDEVGRDIPESAAVLVMTHDHALDQAVIEWALRRGFAFVGGVGSRAKAQRTRDRLESKGYSEADRARIRMPIGLSIGARLPEEIAISIAAELVQWRTSLGEQRVSPKG